MRSLLARNAALVLFTFAAAAPQGSRKRLKVEGAENQILSICSEIPEYSWVLMDLFGCRKSIFINLRWYSLIFTGFNEIMWVQNSPSEKSLGAAAPTAPTVA